MTDVKKLHAKWSKDPAYRAAYDALAPEFELAQQLIAARARAGLSQAQLAARMKTSQSTIARLEGGAAPSFSTLQRYAAATGSRLRVTLAPEPARARRASPRPRAAAGARRAAR